MTLAGHKVNLYYATVVDTSVWFAEDTFEETVTTDMESHSPTGGLSVSPGFGGWTYNTNSQVPVTDDMVVKDYDSAAHGKNNDDIDRSRSTSDVVSTGQSFRVYASFGRAAGSFFGVRAGVRFLVDGADSEDTELDGIDVYLKDNESTTRGHLQVDEYVNGVLVGSKSFYTDTTTNDLPWGLADANPYGLRVEFTPFAGASGFGRLNLTLGDPFADGAYGVPANALTLYSAGDIVDNAYDLLSDRSGKNRMGVIVSGRTSGTGTVGHIAAGAGPATFAELGRCTLTDLEIGAPAIDALSHDSAGYREHIGGVKDWSLGTGFFLVDDATSQSDMFNGLQNHTLLTWKVEPDGSTGSYFQGDGYIKRWSVQAPNEDAIKARLSIAGDGRLQQITS